MKKIISIAMCVVMFTSMNYIVFASSDERDLSGAFSITELSNNSIMITDGNDKGVVHIVEDDAAMRITVSQVEGDVDEGFFAYNKLSGMMYSSYTNQEFSISDVISETEPAVRAAGHVVSRTTHRISYHTLLNAVTPSSSQISIVSALIAIVAAAQSVTISTAAVVVLALFSTGLWDNIRDGLLRGSSRHGIKVVVAKVEIEKHQGGRIVKGYKYEIESVGTY